MMDAKKVGGRKSPLKEEEEIFLGKKFKSDEDEDDEEDEEKEKKSIKKKSIKKNKKKSSKDRDDDSNKNKKNKSEKKKKAKIEGLEYEERKVKPKLIKKEEKKKQKKESKKKKIPKIEGPKYVDFDIDGDDVTENKEKEEQEDRLIEKQKQKEKEKKKKEKEKEKKKKEKVKKLKVKPSVADDNASEYEDNDAKEFREMEKIANKDIEKKKGVDKDEEGVVKNEHDKDKIDESYFYNAELDTIPPNPNAHSGPNDGILADGTFNSKEDLQEIARNIEKENKNLEAINHRNSLNIIQDQFSKNNVQNPVVSDSPPSFSGNSNIDIDSSGGNVVGDSSKEVDDPSSEDGWGDLGGLEKVEEIEKEDQLNRENNPNQKSTEEEYPDLQLEREQINLKENSRFKYFKLTADQEKRAKDLIDNGFEMLNTSTIFQISFQAEADKENSELCIFKLDERSTQSNENRSNFAKLNSLLQQHFTEEKVLKDSETLILPKTNCYDKVEIDSHIDGEFSKVNLQIGNPQPCSASSSIVLQSTKAFYVIPLSFKKQLSVTLTYLPQSELNEILSDGYRTFFLDDNKFIEVLSSYWLIQQSV